MTVDSIGTSQRDVEMIYGKLADTYGRAWTGSFTKPAMRTWWETIYQYPADMVFKVVSQWMEQQPKPPNLQQLLHVLKEYAAVRTPLPQIEGPRPGSAEWKAQKRLGKGFIDRIHQQLQHARPFTSQERESCLRALQADDLETVKGLLRRVGAEL